MPGYKYQPFEYTKPPGLDRREPVHKVVIIGAGPIGLSMAIDLALKGIASVVLDDNNVVSIGSRAICWAKRTLEIFDRLGIGERMLAKGVTWKVGRLFHGEREVYNFDLLPEEGHKYPAFINLQQYYVEQFLIERAMAFAGLIDLRFKNRVIGHQQHEDHVQLDVETPDGQYSLDAQYMLACDGAGSATRKRMNLAFEGQTFDEQFLIVDVEMHESPFETGVPERWFWFEPPFHNGQSALLHKQPDNIYRIDLQLGPQADADKEAKDENVMPRIRQMVGDRPFRLDWKSIYKFRCARLDRFVHDRIIFVGDSAHVVSPFGARGGNGGIQDVDNLGWKLARVLKGEADQDLIETYNDERVHAADENIMNSSRATNFMTPKSPVETLFRKEVLNLASTHPFARKLINSGRLSVPCDLTGFPLQSPAGGKLEPGKVLPDLPFEDGSFLLEHLGQGFLLIGTGNTPLPEIEGVQRLGINQSNRDYPVKRADPDLLAQRLGSDCVYLVRPDAYIAGSFGRVSNVEIVTILRTAMGCRDEEMVAHG